MLSDEQVAELRLFLASGTEEYVASVRRDMMLSLLSAHDDAVRMRVGLEQLKSASYYTLDCGPDQYVKWVQATATQALSALRPAGQGAGEERG